MSTSPRRRPKKETIIACTIDAPPIGDTIEVHYATVDKTVHSTRLMQRLDFSGWFTKPALDDRQFWDGMGGYPRKE
jgi:hypothetical protein